MKNSIHIIVFLLFTTVSVFGQITEKHEKMSLGIQPCLTTEVLNIKVKTVEKLWKKYFKAYGKVKKNKRAKELYSTGVRVNRIKSGDPIDVYLKVSKFEGGVNLCIWYDLGTKFLSEKDTPNEYNAGEELLEEFSIYLRKYIIEKELKTEEDSLKKVKKKLRSSKKKNKKLHEKIKSYKEKILKAERGIKENLLEQDELEKQIETQILKVKEVEEKLGNIGK